jgi:flagellar assembly protein FliH
MSSSREGAVLRGEAAANAVAPWSGMEDRRKGERRAWGRRATDPVPGQEGAGRPGMLLGDVYAAELARLRDQAHDEGYRAGYEEGLKAADAAVAEAERAATARLGEVQAAWERRLASATAAMGAAARQLEEVSRPAADELRDSVLGVVLTLVEDLLGRELALADSPALDAVRRALTLCPSDAPATVRVHPDDLAEIADEALAELPDTVRVVGDPSVERAGAVAESGTRRVDAQLGAALERVQAVLSS